MLNWLRIPLVIWGIATLFYAFEIMLKASMGAVSDIFSNEFLLNNTQLASLSSAFYFTYIILQIPAGILIDKFGVRRMLLLAIFAAFAGTLLFSVGQSYQTFLLARILMGVCGSLGFLCAITLAVQWFSIKSFALIAGLTNFIGYLGGALSGMPLTSLLTTISWQTVYYCFAIACVVIFLLALVFVKDNSQVKNNKNKQKNISIKEIIASVINITSVRN